MFFAFGITYDKTIKRGMAASHRPSAVSEKPAKIQRDGRAGYIKGQSGLMFVHPQGVSDRDEAAKICSRLLIEYFLTS